MKKKYYLSFLIVFTTLYQGFGVLSEEKIKKSSDLLVRQKRLIDNSRFGNRPVNIRQVPYIVSIIKNGVSHCGAVILESSILITAAHCFKDENATYSILSGSSFRNRGIPHTIRRKIEHPHYNRSRYPNDLALLIIYPPINFEFSPNRRITLYSSNIPIVPNTLAIFSGWGSIQVTLEDERTFPNELRSIIVPTISEDDCLDIYGQYIPITNKEICTLDRSGRKGSSYGDSGGPLVINRRLAGIMAWRRNVVNGRDPDIFMNLANSEYRLWIISNVIQIGV